MILIYINGRGYLFFDIFLVFDFREGRKEKKKNFYLRVFGRKFKIRLKFLRFNCGFLK